VANWVLVSHTQGQVACMESALGGYDEETHAVTMIHQYTFH